MTQTLAGKETDGWILRLFDDGKDYSRKIL